MKSLADMTEEDMVVKQVQLTVEQFCTTHNIPWEMKVDARFVGYMTESMMIMLRAHVWGEKRETLIKVPDGFWEYVKHYVKHWAHTPIFIAKRLDVRYIDWEARVFRAYPDFKAPKLYGPQFDRCVVHTMQPLNLTELSR